VTAAARFKEDLSLDSLDVVEVRRDGGMEGGSKGWVSPLCVFLDWCSGSVDTYPCRPPSLPPFLPPSLPPSGGNGDRGGVCLGDP